MSSKVSPVFNKSYKAFQEEVNQEYLFQKEFIREQLASLPLETIRALNKEIEKESMLLIRSFSNGYLSKGNIHSIYFIKELANNIIFMNEENQSLDSLARSLSLLLPYNAKFKDKYLSFFKGEKEVW